MYVSKRTEPFRCHQNFAAPTNPKSVKKISLAFFFLERHDQPNPQGKKNCALRESLTISNES